MKLILLALLSITMVTPSQAGDDKKKPIAQKSTYSDSTEKSSLKTNVYISLTVRVLNDKAYFNLVMMNESKNGDYSLIRHNQDGSVTSIGLKRIIKNNINLPIQYSFVDKDLSDDYAFYELIRITNEVEHVQRWSYDIEGKNISKETYEMATDKPDCLEDMSKP